MLCETQRSWDHHKAGSTVFALFACRSSRFQDFPLNWSPTIPDLEKCKHLKLATLTNLHLHLETYNYERREKRHSDYLQRKYATNWVLKLHRLFLGWWYLQMNFYTDGCFNSLLSKNWGPRDRSRINQLFYMALDSVLLPILKSSCSEQSSSLISSKSKTVTLVSNTEEYHRLSFHY